MDALPRQLRERDDRQHPDGVVLQGQAEAVLRETRQFYIALDSAGVVLSWNRAATQVFGHTAADAVGQCLEELIIPEAHRLAHRRGIEAYARTGHGRGVDAPVQVRALRADGREVFVELTIWAQKTETGYLFHALGTDLTERLAHERLLRVLAEHRRELLHLDSPDEARQLLVDTVRRVTDCDGVWLLDRDETPDEVDLRLRASSTRQESTLPPSALLAARQSLEDGGAPAEGASGAALAPTITRDAAGWTAVEPVVVGAGPVAVLVVRWEGHADDLSPSTADLLALLAAEAGVVISRLLLQAQLAAAAHTDSLTGVANRRAFDDALVREMGRSARTGGELALVLLDLDHFKTYNDTHGHPAGDELLRSVAAAWSGAVRTPDLLARIGGDEFALLLPGADHAAAQKALDRLVQVTPAGVSLSAGVAARHEGDDAAALLQRSDAALYARKRART